MHECKRYYTVTELNTKLAVKGWDLKGMIFAGVNGTLNDHPLNNYKAKDGTVYKLTFQNVLGFTDEDLCNMFALFFDEAYYYKPFHLDDPITMETAVPILNDIPAKALFTFRKNIPKYLSMLYMYWIEYSPINNYDMIEHLIESNKDSTMTTTGSSSGTNHLSTNGTDYVYPYNSDGNQTETKKDASTQTTSDGSSGSNYTTTITHENNKDTDQELDGKTLKGDHTTDHIMDRKGNIGVTTTQQMLESEIALKSKNIIDELFKDIKKEIILPIWK